MNYTRIVAAALILAGVLLCGAPRLMYTTTSLSVGSNPGLYVITNTLTGSARFCQASACWPVGAAKPAESRP